MPNKRFYSLFVKRDGRWLRVSGTSLHKDRAVRFYQSRLLDLTMAGFEVGLRVVPDDRRSCDMTEVNANMERVFPDIRRLANELFPTKEA